MNEWTKQTLKGMALKLVSDGKKINPKSIEHIEGFYKSAKNQFGSYEEFLIECGLNPPDHFHRNRHLSTIKSQAGLLFEEILGDIFAELNLNMVHETIEGCRPDFISRASEKEKWIDAKLTESVAVTSKSIKRYSHLCDKLVLVYLIGNKKDYMLNEKVRVLSVEIFLDRLSDMRADYYRKRLACIKKIAESVNREITDFGEREAV
jgi:hypothetical protein